MKAVRIIIHGRVQGVGYRNWTVRTASRQNLKGWVRNLKSGEVEAVFCGDSASIEAMLEQCARGPMMASVERIERFDAETPPETNFVEKPTV
jgi:acylphosphatase